MLLFRYEERKIFFLIAGSHAGCWYRRHRYRIAGSYKESYSSHRISAIGAWFIWVNNFAMDV
jgi:hypothetical protein